LRHFYFNASLHIDCRVPELRKSASVGQIAATSIGIHAKLHTRHRALQILKEMAAEAERGGYPLYSF
jgi:hypothetical protein